MVLEVAGREVRVTNPSKLYFSEAQVTKLDIVRYFLDVAEGAVQGIADRPVVLKRFVDGAESEPFYQKRAPANHPAWLRTTVLSFPSGRTAEEIVVDDAAGLAWIVNLGCMELHPHAVRAGDLDHPDELRIDLDPVPGVQWPDVRRVAMEVRALLDELGLVGWPKTSGSRGIHVNCRIHPSWGFDQVRRAALALSREIERRAPTIATSKWWKEERHGVFLDYNQNAKDRTTCSAYSVRPLKDARVSAPLRWDEVEACEPGDFTLKTMPSRYRELGHLHADMDASPGHLDKLLEMANRDDAEGLGDAPWPPHYDKRAGEGARVAPSRKKGASAGSKTTKGRTPAHPLIVIARAKKKADALAGLDRWKQRHPEAAALLAPDDILVDTMRGRSSAWTRIRLNLRHVPEALRPVDEPPDPDEDLSSETWWNH
ncbi:MAG: DNA polymerase domain-containing protein [Polyangiaceae bacterium]|nr:DNA polymerase domain-containing protein [Polyangiaceae bacterium]